MALIQCQAPGLHTSVRRRLLRGEGDGAGAEGVMGIGIIAGGEVGLMGYQLRGGQDHLLACDEDALFGHPRFRQHSLLSMDVVFQGLSPQAAPSLGQL